MNEYVDRIRQAAEAVGALIDTSRDQLAEYLNRTRQAAEEIGALVEQSQRQTSTVAAKVEEPVYEAGERKKPVDRARIQWDEFVAQCR